MKNMRLILIVVTLSAILALSSIPTPVFSVPLPLDPLTIPKYVTPLVANIPVYLPTNITDIHGMLIRQEYYINATEFTEQILPTGFPVTKVWGYGGLAYDQLTGANLGYFRHSPSATFEVIRGIPTKITWVNNLTTVSGALLNYLYPVDPTLHWANPNNIPMDAAMMQAMMGLAPPYPPGYNGTAINVNGTITNPNGWNAQSPAPIVTHVHGAEVISGSDGGPEQWWTPNGLHGPDYWTYEPTYPNAAVYYYNNTQEEATLWYHDHALGLTRINVYSGLAGYYIIRDPASTIAQYMPARKYEVPLAIQDRSFFDDGSFRFNVDPPPNPDMHPYWVPEFFGDTMMVNGRVWPYLSVDRTTYRFRLLDGCNARFLNLTVTRDDNNASIPFTVVARDQGWLKAPAVLNNVIFGPGQRVEVLVDFSSIPAGTNVTMRNHAASPFPFGAPVDPATTGQVMQFRVQAASAPSPPALPGALNPGLTGTFPSLPASTATRQRTMTLTEVMGMGGPLEVLLDGQKWGAPTSELPVDGTTENWVIANPTADAHPMHWHLVQFQLVSRQPFNDIAWLAAWEALNGAPPLTHPTITPGNLSSYYTGPPEPIPADEQGWLDTVIMYPGQVTTIRIRYKQQDNTPYPFDPTAGPGYVWHCHIVDHEDNEMMRRQIVIKPSQLPPLANVIRGLGSGILYRKYNFDTSSWSTLAPLIGGTVDSPASAVASGKLYVAVRGTDGFSLWFGSVDMTSDIFSGWTWLPGSTPSAPTLAANGTHVALVVRGSNNMVYYSLYSTATMTWGAWNVVPNGATCDRPAAAMIGNRLYVVVRGLDTVNAAGNNTLWSSSVDVTTGAFSGWSYMPGSTASAPTLAAFHATNALELIVRGGNDMIYLNSWDSAAWQGWTVVPSGSTLETPATTIARNDMYFTVLGMDGNTVWFSSINQLTGTFSGWTPLSGSTNSAPSLTN